MVNSRIRNLLEQRRANKEKGNTLVVFVLMFPLLFGVFGCAVDLAIGTYTNTTLQSALDTATQSALSRATNPGTNGNTTFNPLLTKDEAHQYIVDFYDVNRSPAAGSKENAFVICQSGGNIHPSSGCGWTENSYNLVKSGRTLTANVEVHELSNPVFIHILGIHEIQYTITSSARTTFATG